MFFVDATYDNSDAKCSRDDEIVLLIQNNCGEVRGRDDCCGNQRCICGCFPGRFGAERAVKALEALGIETDLREDEGCDDEVDEEPEPMHTVAINYDNSDGQFRHDALIRSTMCEWGGEEIGCGQDLRSCTRDIAFDFAEKEDREAACGELQEAVGDEVEISFAPEEPESTLLAVEYNRGQSWIPQEIVALLTFDLCVGWRRFGDTGDPDNEAILVDCRSIAAATYLKHKIETGPLDRWVFAYSIPDEQPATPSLN
jgi:hypothetical protein